MLPKAKKALRAFLMFSVTDFDAERFHYHQTPKHLAADVVDMVFPAMTMDSDERGCCDSLITSNFDTFNLRQLLEVNSSMMLTWSLMTFKEYEVVRRSSA